MRKSIFRRLVKQRMIDLKEKRLLDQYAQEASFFRRLTFDEILECGRLIKEVDNWKGWVDAVHLEARNKLVRHNLLLVVFWANRFAGGALPILDIIQEGNLGLIRAAQKYDPDLGYKFSTYAGWLIVQYIERAFDNYEKQIRVPVHFVGFRSQVMKAFVRLAEEFDREPSVAELAEELSLPQEKIAAVLETARRSVVSLEKIIYEGKNGDHLTLGESIASRSYLDPDRYTEVKEELQALVERVNSFCQKIVFHTDRERNIFISRYGLNVGLRDGKLKEVAELCNITRQRVDQILGKIWQQTGFYGADGDEYWFKKQLDRIDELASLICEPIEPGTFIFLEPKPRIHRRLAVRAVVSFEVTEKSLPQPMVAGPVSNNNITPVHSRIIGLSAKGSYISLDEFFSDQRRSCIVWAQDSAAFLLHKELGLSFNEIATVLRRGTNDTSIKSVKKSVVRVEKSLETSKVWRMSIGSIRKQLSAERQISP